MAQDDIPGTFLQYYIESLTVRKFFGAKNLNIPIRYVSIFCTDTETRNCPFLMMGSYLPSVLYSEWLVVIMDVDKVTKEVEQAHEEVDKMVEEMTKVKKIAKKLSSML